jgi:DNA (cytosine-5)-methyltransferase 1|tara:strand:+ start:95 stop:1081 length:987 start_codon:yes stop_codon:yes gene_type:complete
MALKVGGLFSGVGGIELGFQKAGFKIAWANEIDKDACVTYSKNFKHNLYQEDIHKLKGKNLESVDVLTGGFPCQAFSLAGKREGFDDHRGNLFFEIMRLVDELKEKPKVLFLENVKNLRTHDKGNTFSKIANIIQEEYGYSFFSTVLNTADYTKVPQNRERTFIIAFRDEVNWKGSPNGTLSKKFFDLFPPNKLLKPDSIEKYLDKDEVDEKFFYRQDKYNYKELREAMRSKETIYQWRRIYVRENKKKLCPTLTANMGTGGHNVPLILTDDGIRKLTPRECFNFQGYPRSFKLPKNLSNAQLYKQAGNSVSVPLIKKLAESIKKVLE